MRNIFVAATIFPFLCFQSLVFSQPFTLVKDINPGRLGLGVVREPVNLTESNGSIFFNIQTSGAPNGLWKSDGTEEGTVRFEGFSADKMINVNGTLFFINGSAFCKSDGTQAGTEVVKTFSYKADNLTNVKGKLYFTVDVAKFTKVNDSVTYVSYDKELWKSDGTEGGTEAIKEFSYVQNMVAVGDLLFFSANESAAPDRDFVKLWKSDGTPGGTLLVKDIYTGSWNANSPNFFNANGVLYFLGWEDTHGAELWKSDGTEAGTVLIKDIEPGSDGITVSSFCMLNNNAYFFAKTPANVVGFWKTDGTAAGTLLVKDMGNFNPPSSLIRVNNTLFFSAYDNSVDRELWKSDGTTAGNVIVKNINRDGSSFPRNLIDVNGVLYFFADDNSVP